MNISAEMLPCFSLLLESFNGSPFRASEEVSERMAMVKCVYRPAGLVLKH